MFKFYANINGTNEGPFTLEELKELASKKKITPKTFVIIEGTEEWLPAKDVEGIFKQRHYVTVDNRDLLGY